MLTELPRTLATRLIVAYVAFLGRDSDLGVELSVRSVQWLLRRRSHETGSSILRRGVEEGWLCIVDHHSGRKAHSYDLGPRAVKELDEWHVAGTSLFGKPGLMHPWLTSGWMYEKRRGGLDIPGCLVLALLGADEATPNELAQRSHGLISKATASRELAVLTARHITTRDISKRPATFRRVVSDAWLGVREIELQLADLAAKDDEKIAEERARHDDIVGAPRREHRNWLRTQNCLYCLRPGSEDEPIEIEHLPPRKLGGGPLTGFEIPAHRRCHGPHSAAIRRLSEHRPPGPIHLIEVSDAFWEFNDEELLDMLAAETGPQIMHYAAAMNGGDIAEGYRTALNIAGLAAAIASPQGALILRHKVTGAERHLDIDRWFFQREVVATARAWTAMTAAFADPAPPPTNNAP